MIFEKYKVLYLLYYSSTFYL